MREWIICIVYKKPDETLWHTDSYIRSEYPDLSDNDFTFIALLSAKKLKDSGYIVHKGYLQTSEIDEDEQIKILKEKDE